MKIMNLKIRWGNVFLKIHGDVDLLIKRSFTETLCYLANGYENSEVIRIWLNSIYKNHKSKTSNLINYSN